MAVIATDKCDHHSDMLYGNEMLGTYCLDCETWLEEVEERRVENVE